MAGVARRCTGARWCAGPYPSLLCELASKIIDARRRLRARGLWYWMERTIGRRFDAKKQFISSWRDPKAAANCLWCYRIGVDGGGVARPSYAAQFYDLTKNLQVLTAR